MSFTKISTVSQGHHKLVSRMSFIHSIAITFQESRYDMGAVVYKERDMNRVDCALDCLAACEKRQLEV